MKRMRAIERDERVEEEICFGTGREDKDKDNKEVDGRRKKGSSRKMSLGFCRQLHVWMYGHVSMEVKCRLLFLVLCKMRE